MDSNRLPKQALQYKPKGRRNVGRPSKRWRDQLHLVLHEHDDDDEIICRQIGNITLATKSINYAKYFSY